MSVTWDEVEIPQGSFYAWGTASGQKLVGAVLEYSPDGGTDFNGNPCPQVTVELREESHSIKKDGTRINHGVGDLITVSGGLAQLKAGLRQASPAPGDLIRVELTGTTPGAKGDIKQFDIKIARGAAAGSSAPASAPAAAPAAAELQKPEHFPQNVWDGLDPVARQSVVAAS